MRTDRYVIERRSASGDLILDGVQPEALFGIRAITGISEDEMARVILKALPDAILEGTTIATWPALINSEYIARKRVW